MGVTNSQYSPLGVASPITIRLKVAMRNMYRRKLTWDEQLPLDMEKNLKTQIKMLVEAGRLEFSRCVRPDDALGKSTMVVYFDGSDDAFSAVVYMRWQVRGGGYVAKLLTAKSKVSSMWGTSTPRVEMDDYG